ncbi:Sarcosine dehydrogenase, mitochondrial [Chionoecetes opilio]|uniref:Sarcosine dehydrogenase, mitochondrial n=1 Tax=Chionoecetes opilio TaxID=41210 RepID=A0A8J4XPI6_CHIOP|nr:Sarcosine dehydrogenase, mitochondrial [Chionoecetes opilio]
MLRGAARRSGVLVRAARGGRLVVRAATGGGSLRPSSTAAATQVDGVGAVPGEADVVVVGGGVLGCSCLYHLAQLGVTNTVLLEAHQLTAGTTWHTAGMMHFFGKTETEYLLRDVTAAMVRRLEGETGVSPGWIQNGSLLVSSTEEPYSEQRKNELERLVTFMHAVGLDCELVPPAQVKDIYPIMETGDINCAVYSATGGQVEPAGLCEGLSRWAVGAGARVVQGCPVTDITTTNTLLGGRRVSHVHTAKGVIKTNAVINTTGGWGNDITSMIGVTLPLQSFKHGYVVTEKIEGAFGMPNVRNYVSSAYCKTQGDGMIVGAFEPNPEPIEKLSPNFPFGLYEMNWDNFGPRYESITKRIPALGSVGIKSTIWGPESFTPDGNPIVGEDPDVQGFFHCCGFNSHGMQLSGGMGDQIAKWVVRGEPEIDLFAYDVRRFHPPLSKNKPWVLARSQECLISNYSVSFPHDDPLAGRGQRLSPLHKDLEAAGSVFQERNGWEATRVVPFQSGANRAGVRGLQEQAAVFDMTSFGKYFLTGPDAQKAADWIFSADMTRAAGSTVYTCMLNQRGGVEADLSVSVCEGGEGAAHEPGFEGRGFYITTGGSTARYCAQHILMESRRQGFRVDLTDHTEDLALISVQGPHSRDILQQLTRDDLGDAAFPYPSHRVISLAGHTLRALRLSFVGELGKCLFSRV